MITDQELAGLLTGSNLIDRHRLDDAIAMQKRYGGSLYDVVIENGFVDEELAIEAVANKLGIPCVSLRDFEAEMALINLVDAHTAAEHRVVPVGLSEDGHSLYLAMASPIDLVAMQAVGDVAGCDIVALLAGPLDIDRTIERLYGHAEAEPSSPMSMGGLFMAPPSQAPASSLDELDDVLNFSALDNLDDGELLVEELLLPEEPAEDLLDLYGEPEEDMFTDDGLFAAPGRLTEEGRKRLAEAQAVEEEEIAAPNRGKTEGFRGWDDDDAMDPRQVDRGLFTGGTGPAALRPSTSKPRRVFKKRETAVTGAREKVKVASSDTLELPPPPPPPPAAPRLPPSSPEQPAPRIGATFGEVSPDSGRPMRRMGRPESSSAEEARSRPTPRGKSLQQIETRQLVLGLVKVLLKQGVLSPEDLLIELQSMQSTPDGD